MSESRPRNGRPALALAIALALIGGCAAPWNPSDWVSVREVSPSFLADMKSADPSIAADPHGRVALTFVTRDSSGTHLWLSVSRDSGMTFTEPVRMNERGGYVHSTPSTRPMVALGPGAAVAVGWMEWAAGDRHQRFMVRASRDGGLSLAEPARITRSAHHQQGLSGGVITFLDDGSLFAAWIVGRRAIPALETALDSTREEGRAQVAPGEDAEAHGVAPGTVAQLRGALSPDGGREWPVQTRLADSVCACAPAVRGGPDGRVAIVFQRAQGADRAPALIVSDNGGRSFTLDTLLSQQRWRLDTCPRQGLALEWTHDRGGLAAWSSGAGERGVHVVHWQLETGMTARRLGVADDFPVARHPKLSSLGDATLIAAEGRPAAALGRSVFGVRLLDGNGSLTPWCFLGADAEAGWVAGTGPRSGIACWTEREGESHRARVVTLRRRLPG